MQGCIAMLDDNKKLKPNREKNSITAKGKVRYQKILDAAYRMFLENGYEKVSMNEIVRKAGGSLATIYKLFGSKEQLFNEILEQKTQELFGGIKQERIQYEGRVRDFLTYYAKFVLSFVVSDESVLFHRLIIADGHKNNALLGKLLMKNRHSVVLILSEYFEGEKNRGSIEVQDTILLASQFFCALKDPFMFSKLIGVEIDTSSERLDMAIEQIVDVFCRGVEVRS